MDEEGRLLEQQLMEALAHRTNIGIALGILMERLGLTEQQALAALRRASSYQNRKLHVIAAELAKTGELPPELSRR